MKNKLSLTILSITGLLAGPLQSFAAGTPTVEVCPTGIRKLVDLLTYPSCFINKLLMPALIGIAVVSVLYTITKFIINADDEANRKRFRTYFYTAMIALAVILTANSLIGVIANTLEIGQGGTFNPPQFKE